MNIEKLKHVELDVPENVVELIPCQSKVRKWAHDNAYTLIFLTFMFAVTWIIGIVAIVWK